MSNRVPGAAADLAFLDGQSGFLEATGLRADGQRIDTDVAVTSMEHEGQRIFIIAVRDVTEKRRAEKRARDSQSILTDAVESRAGRLRTVGSR